MYPLALYALLQLFGFVYALEVSPNSPCFSVCVDDPKANPAFWNSSTTTTSDLVCNDWELVGPNATSSGRLFHDCMLCEEKSTNHDTSSNENDQYWFLFHAKYTIDYCLFNYTNENPTPQSGQCADACRGPAGVIQQALEDRLVQWDPSRQYQYCRDNGGAFAKNVDTCMGCLGKAPASTTLVNYLHALQEACEQQPPIGGNTPVRLSFDLYPTTLSSPEATSSNSTAASNSTTNSTNNATNPHSNRRAIRLGLGLGLGLGVPAAILAAFLWLLHRKRLRQRIFEKEEELRRLQEAAYHQRMQSEKPALQHEIAEIAPGKYFVAEKHGQPVSELS
ncbi:MAG: hypothetical protein Q9212_004536 [Teloschistes hypoglaucus]